MIQDNGEINVDITHRNKREFYQVVVTPTFIYGLELANQESVSIEDDGGINENDQVVM